MQTEKESYAVLKKITSVRINVILKYGWKLEFNFAQEIEKDNVKSAPKKKNTRLNIASQRTEEGERG